MRKALAALAFLAATVSSVPALAAQLKVSVYPTSRNVWFTNVGTDASDPDMVEFPAALLGITDLSVPSSAMLPAYCVQPEEWLTKAALGPKGASYTSSANTNTDVQRLFDAFFFSSITSVAKQAGFQLALWELVYDDGNLRQGKLAFRPEQRRDRDARSALLWGNYYLRNYLSFERVGAPLVVQWWQNEGSQDLITATRPLDTEPVPLPAPLVLLGSALAVVLRFRARGRNA